MTGRTHDLAAFTTLTFIVATGPLIKISLATIVVAISANMIGGLAPDLDQPTGKLWHKVPAGGILGRIVHPFLGAHRSISHSILGAFLFGYLIHLLFNYTKTFLIVNYQIVWFSFMLGFVSHLIMDSFTKEGVPWLFPIPIRFGIPPIRALRITTGKFVERIIVFPGLLILNGWLIYNNYGKFINFIRHYIT